MVWTDYCPSYSKKYIVSAARMHATTHKHNPQPRNTPDNNQHESLLPYPQQSRPLSQRQHPPWLQISAPLLPMHMGQPATIDWGEKETQGGRRWMRRKRSSQICTLANCTVGCTLGHFESVHTPLCKNYFRTERSSQMCTIQISINIKMIMTEREEGGQKKGEV